MTINKLIISCLFLLIFLPIGSVSAACIADNTGAIYCAKEPIGEVIIDNMGAVLCGKGQCATDITGAVYCSKVAGGGVAKDNTGAIYCLGGCERATKNMCVRGEK